MRKGRVRVLLINPNILPYPFFFKNFSVRKNTPLGLSCIASFIEKHGYEVKILDASSDNLSERDIAAVIKEYQPEVVGVSSSVHYELGENIVALCKQINKHIITVLGGITPSAMPVEIMEHITQLDYIVRGEGEIPFLCLLEGLEEKRNLKRIKGLVYRTEDRTIVVNEEGDKILDLNDLSFPESDLFVTKNRRDYFSNKNFITMELSRGCNFACTFCVVKGHFGEGIRFHQVEKIVDYMEKSVRTHGIKNFYFVDSTFTASRSFLERFLEKIMQGNFHKRIKIGFMTRADCVDRAMLKKLRQANCVSIAYGVETHSQVRLDGYNKKLSQERIVDTFHLTREARIKTIALMIIDQYATPDRRQVHEEADSLIRFLRYLRVDWLVLNPLVIFPGGPLYSEILHKGAIKQDGYKELFQGKYISSLYLSNDELEDLMLRIYSRLFFKGRVKSFFGKRLKRLMRS